MKKGHRSGKRRGRRQRRYALTAFCVALAVIMLGLIGYVAYWYLNLGRIRAEGERYAQLYTGRDQAAPTQTPVLTAIPAERPTQAPTAAITQAPKDGPTQAPTAVPTASPTEGPTAAPTEASTMAPTDAPTPVPTAEPSPTPTTQVLNADMPVVVDEPIPTPDEDTLVIALPTPPPVQDSFAELLALNPDTVGFLDIEGMLSLPVVQRENDNDFYLDHSFKGASALEGALFLDGMNRLVPEDDCLIVYGHNMKNKTMFGRLNSYEDISFLRQHSVVHFDTIYENRAYVVFAAFTASMEPKDRRYFDVRNFIFDDVEFDKFVLKLQSRSMFNIPIDVRYGDRLLLLVTCDYTSQEGRFILALRQVRVDESESNMWAQALQAEAK